MGDVIAVSKAFVKKNLKKIVTEIQDTDSIGADQLDILAIDMVGEDLVGYTDTALAGRMLELVNSSNNTFNKGGVYVVEDGHVAVFNSSGVMIDVIGKYID